MEMGIEPAVNGFVDTPEIEASAEMLASKMTEAKMQKEILTKVGELTAELMGKIASSFNVDPDKIARAFKFDLTGEIEKSYNNVKVGYITIEIEWWIMFDKKVLILSGSPRIGGNSDILCDEFIGNEL